MIEETFRYSDDQWRAILTAAGPMGEHLVRSDWEDLADALRWHNDQVTGPADNERRRAAISELEKEISATSCSRERGLLDRQLASARRYQAVYEGVRSARQPKACREGLIREALRAWLDLGNGRPGRTNPHGVKPWGPAARFTRALFDPVFFSPALGKSGGPLLVTTVNEVIEKMKKEGEFRFHGKLNGQTEKLISHISARRFVLTRDGSEANTEPPDETVSCPGEPENGTCRNAVDCGAVEVLDQARSPRVLPNFGLDAEPP